MTLIDVSTFTILLLMFMFIFSLLGMELFGFKVFFLDDLSINEGDKNFEKALAPRPNFNDMAMSFTSIFAVAIGDDWNLFMMKAFRAEGSIALFYYPVVFIVMNLVLLNLFLAILLHNFEETSGSKEEKVNEAEEKKLAKFNRRVKKKCRPCIERYIRTFSCCIIKEEDI